MKKHYNWACLALAATFTFSSLALSGCHHKDTEDYSWFRRKDAWIVSFFIPVFIMIVIFIQRGIFPFGDECFLRTDLYHQYAPFFSEFKYKLSTGGSLLYSWDVGMGVNFSAIYAYYLASPLNWLIVLCPKKYVIEFITIMIVVKTGLCGLTMTWYLHRRNTRAFGLSVAFGTMFALSNFVIGYYFNLMWLDSVAMLPLVMCGIEQICGIGRNRVLTDSSDGRLYGIALAFGIWCNYYIKSF